MATPETLERDSDTGQEPATEKVPSNSRGYISKAVFRNRAGLLGTIIIISLFVIAFLVAIDKYILTKELISTILYDPTEIDATAQLSAPSTEHPLGTDTLGRDVLSRIIYGSIISLQVGIMAVGISVIIGTTMGVVAGYYGGIVDDSIMRIVDVLLAFPGIILAIAVTGVLGPSIRNVIAALAVQGWVTYARLIRGEVLTVREREYIKAAKSVGASDRQIILRDILPNTIYPVIVQATLGVGGFILAEAGLSFLGLGPQPPTPSWGIMLSTGRSYVESAWWLSLFPGLAIFITVMGFNLFGDVLRDVLDPRDSTNKGRQL